MSGDTLIEGDEVSKRCDVEALKETGLSYGVRHTPALTKRSPATNSHRTLSSGGTPLLYDHWYSTTAAIAAATSSIKAGVTRPM